MIKLQSIRAQVGIRVSYFGLTYSSPLLKPVSEESEAAHALSHEAGGSAHLIPPPVGIPQFGAGMDLNRTQGKKRVAIEPAPPGSLKKEDCNQPTAFRAVIIVGRIHNQDPLSDPPNPTEIDPVGVIRLNRRRQIEDEQAGPGPAARRVWSIDPPPGRAGIPICDAEG